jgi:hypothetical protein
MAERSDCRMRGRGAYLRGFVGMDARDLFVLVLAVTVCVARSEAATSTNFAKTTKSSNNISTISSSGGSSSDAVVNVQNLGAKGDGKTDDTKVRSERRRTEFHKLSLCQVDHIVDGWQTKARRMRVESSFGSVSVVNIDFLIDLKWMFMNVVRGTDMHDVIEAVGGLSGP